MKKKQKNYHKKQDPNLAREQEQYQSPVPSREYILQYLEEIKRPTTLNNLTVVFELEDEEEREGLRRRLIAMSRDGQLISIRRHTYGLVSHMELVKGRISAHRDGFGFLVTEDDGDDIFLPAREMRGVFHDDIVLVRVTMVSARRREGVIAKVLERNTQQLVGRYFEEDGVAFISPDSQQITQDIMVPLDQKANATVGQFVVVEITTQPTTRRQAVGRIIEVLGDQLTSGMEVELAIRSYHLPFRWSDEVLAESQRFAAQVSEADAEGRSDLRQLPFVTIDGGDAKDFDDAVYCETLPKNKGWKLYVAIADVSHYVLPNSVLDEEAFLRGNSVYFPAKVVPMLPESLSNNLCSLKPDVDRLALVAEILIKPSGEVGKSRFFNAVIHSHARLTYNKAAELLLAEKSNHPRYDDLKALEALYRKLLEQRQLRGALEFNTTETRIQFDDKGKIDQIIPVVRNDAHRLIEEMMLVANICAAKLLAKNKINILYRVHQTPKPAKLLALRKFLRNVNLRLLGGDEPSAKDYANLMTRINKRDDAHLLQTVLLRSLPQAQYSTENNGHFGLAYDAYTHFTSPIRRYPDLLVHRAIKHLVEKKSRKLFQYDTEKMQTFATHCSTTERRADRATREAIDWLKCDFMQDKVGKTFMGRIVEVTAFGLFVELDDIYVQGLLHINSLKNDYYHYDASLYLLRGKSSNHVYRLSDSITVLVARVDIDRRSIDFELG